MCLNEKTPGWALSGVGRAFSPFFLKRIDPAGRTHEHTSPLRLMKNFILFLLFCVCAASFAGCAREIRLENESRPQGVQIR